MEDGRNQLKANLHFNFGLLEAIKLSHDAGNNGGVFILKTCTWKGIKSTRTTMVLCILI